MSDDQLSFNPSNSTMLMEDLGGGLDTSAGGDLQTSSLPGLQPDIAALDSLQTQSQDPTAADFTTDASTSASLWALPGSHLTLSGSAAGEQTTVEPAQSPTPQSDSTTTQLALPAGTSSAITGQAASLPTMGPGPVSAPASALEPQTSAIPVPTFEASTESFAISAAPEPNAEVTLPPVLAGSGATIPPREVYRPGAERLIPRPHGPGLEDRGQDPTNVEKVGVLKGPVTTSTPTSLTVEPTSANPIVLENQKTGTPQSEWDITGAGSSNIEGFATDISINRGNRVDFKINTNSSNYRIDIYRLGYYGGTGARKVTTLQHTGVQSQPTPLRDSTTGLVDAGNWAVSASWDIPADATSGIYIAKLVRQDGTFGENHIPFIVRDDASTSDIIFQTSDETWQAYNPWGGANLYQGNGPGADSSPGRAYKVSYNRPITTRGGGLAAGPQDFIFGVEYPAIQWLEKNGYDVAYATGVDSDRLGSLLKNHKMFLSVGHDEYWSGPQRANVEAARDAGVNLAFWSGNEVYWKTRFENSLTGAGNQPYRTLVSYKETRAGPIDPSNEWTGTFRDPRFAGPSSVGAGNPENSLTGTMFQVDSYRLDAIQIPYDDANQRFWRNTSVANLQPGQSATLNQNYLGYEWDAATDNGFDPAGLVKLSSTTLPVGQYLLDYGTRTGSYPTATHNLTLYRAPSGALVFGAGTVYWAWGLDSNHDLEPTPVDPRIKQAMVNLLADMGIQPGTLETGLVAASQSTDTTKPTSTITAPNDGSALKVGDKITITGTAADVGGVIAGVEISTDSGTTWHPVNGDETWSYRWVPNAPGTFTIKTRAVDDSVNLEVPAAGRTVTVSGNNLFAASARPPTAAELDPNPIELGMKFQSSVAGTVTGVRFYKNDLNIGTHTGTLWSSTGQKLASATFENETGNGWQAVSFSNPVAITANTTYTVSYHADYGYYSANANGFSSPVTNGPITAPANAGVYTYGTSALPTSVYNSENYWVDVLFNPTTATTNQPPVANADTGFTTSQNTVLTIQASTLLANDTDQNGDALTITGVSGPSGGTVTFQNNTVTFTPTTGYTGPAGFTYAITDGKGGTATANVSITVNAPVANRPPVANPDNGFSTAKDTAINIPAATLLANDTDPDSNPLTISGVSNPAGGNVTLQNNTVTFTPTAGYTGIASFSYTASDGQANSTPGTVNLAVGASSLFSATATPATLSDPDRTGVELGTKFQATSAGTVSGIRFYKGTGDTGPHTGTLWSNTGSNLGTVTFQNETASGWQTATFSSPITISPNTTYVVSYHSNGGYASTGNYFQSAVTNGPLTAPSSSSSGGNGVYAYGSTTTFPASTFGATNYWVDVLFNQTTSAVNQPPVAANDSGFTTTSNTAITIAASSLLTNDSDPDGDPLSVTGANNATNGTVSFDTTTKATTFTPTTGYSGPASFSYAISDGRGGTATANVSITVNAPTTTNSPPVANADSGFSTTRDTAVNIAASALLANDTDPNGDTLTITGVTSDSINGNGTASLNTSTNTVTFTPTAGYTGPANFSYTIADGRGGSASANVSLTVNAPTTGGAVSLFSDSAIPARLSVEDSPVELGMKFRASTGGTISGIKFFKGTGETGTHSGTLWTSTGTALGTLNFQNESASGWQTATFTSPIAINPNTTYVVSYHSNGRYAATGNYFQSSVSNGPLTAPSSSSSGGNGVYAYGGSSLFPTNSHQRTNYWVDVLFNPLAA